ncbi:trypsin-like peptidase domain-containing protein [Candidatus Pacearchaeota archaeon]|nr:trypsin-like peptidase domain-containing protein [Candidatus Pacearchaeota archaeon]
MSKYQDENSSHKTHRNVLYGIVVILIVFQTVSFTVLSLQISKLNIELESTSANLSSQFNSRLESNDANYRAEFKAIGETLAQQKADIKQEINLIKSSQEDFSGIIEDSVRSIVSVATDKSVGSGFVVNSEGYILTNQHVIADATKISVLTYDREILSAKLIASDEKKDVALLKVSENIEALELADSSNLQVGKKVIAIGNPYGLSFTVTEGIISALDRSGPGGNNIYIQTDVSLNPGNSGGPLIDTEGKVIGINNFKVGGEAEGLGFALESNEIKLVINQLTNQTIIT